MKKSIHPEGGDIFSFEDFYDICIDGGVRKRLW